MAESNTSKGAMRAWHDWMQEYEGELHTLTPIGNGVVFTEQACKGVKVDRDW